MDGKNFYITKEKLHELKKEYEELLNFEREQALRYLPVVEPEEERMANA